jgi:transposase
MKKKSDDPDYDEVLERQREEFRRKHGVKSKAATIGDIAKPLGRAAAATVEALMYSLRTRGVWALTEPATKRRLAELSDAQVDEVGTRLQRLKPHIARAWTADEVKQLLKARR